jgi:tetratricopeptide (TPR) repeat protein
MNTKMTSRLIKRAEKLYDSEKYQEAIDLLLDKPSRKDKQNPDYWLFIGWYYYHENFEDNKKKIIESLSEGIKLFEENPKSFTDLKEDIKESKNLIVEAYAKIGLYDINNKKTVEKCCEYILSHIADCSNFESYYSAGEFLSFTMLLVDSDYKEIDTVLELLHKAADLFNTNVEISRIEFELVKNLAFSQKGCQCFEEGDFNNVQVYVEKILASENKIPDDIGWLPYLFNIGMFLTACYTNRHFMNLNDDISSIASVYFHECLKSDEKYFQDGGNLGLGLLNLENEKVAWNYFSKFSKSNKEINDLRIFFKVIIKLRGKPKDAIKELKSLNNSEVIPKVVVDLFLCVMHFEDKQDETGAKILNSLSRSDFAGELVLILPAFHLPKKRGSIRRSPRLDSKIS